MHELTGPDDARRMVNFWADEGATSFKAYMNITREELRAAVEEAHKRGLKVTGHLCSIGFKEAAEIGIDDLEHGLFPDSEFVANKQPDVCPGGAVNQSLLNLDINGQQVQEKEIGDIENVEIVFKDGVGYDSQKIIDSVQGLVGIR